MRIIVILICVFQLCCNAQINQKPPIDFYIAGPFNLDAIKINFDTSVLGSEKDASLFTVKFINVDTVSHFLETKSCIFVFPEGTTAFDKDDNLIYAASGSGVLNPDLCELSPGQSKEFLMSGYSITNDIFYITGKFPYRNSRIDTIKNKYVFKKFIVQNGRLSY